MELSTKKKILFISCYFPPETNSVSYRTFDHCKIWAMEHDITVITNFPTYPFGKIYKGYKNRQSKKENIEGINVIRLFTLTISNRNYRFLAQLWFMCAAILYIVFKRLEFDVVIATVPEFLCGLAGSYIKKLRHKPFILEIRDMWPESLIAEGSDINKRILSFFEHQAQKLYESADKIVTVTRSFKESLIKRNIPASRIETIFNGVSADVFSTYSNISNKEISSFLSTGFKVGYIGTIGMAHSIITLVNAAAKLKDADVRLAVIGSGAERRKLEKEIYERSIKNMRIFSTQPRNEIPAIIHSLDVFCVHLKKSDLFKTVIPSKIFEGMMMEKPILFGVDGETRKIIETARCGVYFEPENVDDLVDKIMKMKSDPVGTTAMGRNGYRFVRDNFNRQRLAEVYLQLILSVINGNA